MDIMSVCGRVLRLRVPGALFVPTLTDTLLSVPQLQEHNVICVFHGAGVTINTMPPIQIAYDHVLRANRFTVLAPPALPRAAARAVLPPRERVRLWHERLGHPDITQLPSLTATLSSSTKVKPSDLAAVRPDWQCDACMRGKAHRSPFHAAASPPAPHPLHTIHADVIDGFAESEDGFRCALVAVDEATRFVWAVPLRSKGHAGPELTRLIAREEARQQAEGYRVAVVRTDGGGEFAAIGKMPGITHQTTVRDSSPSNGVAERANGTLQARMRTLLVSADMSDDFWPEAIRAAAFYQVRVSSRSLGPPTPYERLRGRPPRPTYSRPFGAAAYLTLFENERASKSAPSRAQVGYVVGFDDEETKGYAFLVEDGAHHKIVWRRDVEWVKNAQVSPRARSPSHDTHSRASTPAESEDELDLLRTPRRVARGAQLRSGDAARPTSITTGGNGHPPVTLAAGLALAAQASPAARAVGENCAPASRCVQRLPQSYVPPLSSASPAGAKERSEKRNIKDVKSNRAVRRDLRAARAQASVDATLVPCPRLGASGFAPNAPPAAPARALQLIKMESPAPAAHARAAATVLKTSPALATTADGVLLEPQHFRELVDRPDCHEWWELMREEMHQLLNIPAMRYVDEPPGCRPVGSRWVYKTKTDGDGRFLKRRARLTAQGFSQREGYDFTDTFAAVTTPTAVLALLAIAQHTGLHVTSFDVSTAYLHAPLQEKVYMRAPAGFPSPPGKVLELTRALYGLRQSGHAWAQHLARVLRALHFRQFSSDTCLWLRDLDGERILLATYVDDVVCAASTVQAYSQLLNDLRTHFPLTDQGPLREFLGVTYTRVSGGFALHQRANIDALLSAHGLASCNPVTAPLPPGVLRARADSEPQASTEECRAYASIIGTLLWLTRCTRPDIGFAVRALGQYASDPSPQHFAAVKHLMRYLRGTRELHLHLQPTSNEPIAVFTDADFANDPDSRRSVSGVAVFVFGALVAWRSIRQDGVARSTGEAELAALSDGVREAECIRQLLLEAHVVDHDYRYPAYCDSAVAVALANKDGTSGRLKHVDIKVHYARDLVARHRLIVHKIAGKDNCADPFTKPLARDAVRLGCARLGLRPLDERLPAPA